MVQRQRLLFRNHPHIVRSLTLHYFWSNSLEVGSTLLETEIEFVGCFNQDTPIKPKTFSASWSIWLRQDLVFFLILLNIWKLERSFRIKNWADFHSNPKPKPSSLKLDHEISRRAESSSPKYTFYLLVLPFTILLCGKFFWS